MDSFFKAAVCDLDKVLDDFELNAEEADCKLVFWKASPCDSSLLASSLVSDVLPSPDVNLFDLSSIRYALPGPSWAEAERKGEVQAQPLTEDDLLSSADRTTSQSLAPTCPDQVLEPVCDLLNYTGSAFLVRAKDAFTEPRVSVEREEEPLLVDFGDLEEQGPPCKNSDSSQQLAGFSLNLFDVILPAVPTENERDEYDTQDEGYDEGTQQDDVLSEQDCRCQGSQTSSPSSCQNKEMPPKDTDNETSEGGLQVLELKEQQKNIEEDPPSGLDTYCLDELCNSDPIILVPAAKLMCSDPPEPSPEDPPKFRFEYLPESEWTHMPVTDVELDAFLRASAEAERDIAISQEDPRQRNEEELALTVKELRSCPENLACLKPNSSEQMVFNGGAKPKLPLVPAVRCLSSTEENEPPAYSFQLDNNDEESLQTSHNFSSISSPPYPGTSAAALDQLCKSPTYTDSAGTEWLGSRQPAWVPDSAAPNCMKCLQKFTFTKRRHHCRACGKVYCAVCCNRKCQLKYLEKEARVCVICFDTLHRAQALERMMSPTGPLPNVPSEYCSSIPPLQQARAADNFTIVPPTVTVPVSALKQPSSDGGLREKKRVWFADGILPNGEVADTAKLSASCVNDTSWEAEPSSGPELLVSEEEIARSPRSPWDYALLARLGPTIRRAASLLPDDENRLPPLLVSAGEDLMAEILVEESPAPCQIRCLLEEGGVRPLTFVLNANLVINVNMVTYGAHQCWCLSSNGLRAWGQRELVFMLACIPKEKNLPRDLLALFIRIQQDAQRGKFLEELDNVSFADNFLDSKDHGGILFFSPSFQPLDGLPLPEPPFLFGLLVHKLEVPWAKVFPLRLLLRLGVEYSVYPATPVSVRFRPSVYRETGHTIMNLLADLRNYQYSLPSVKGLTIHMEMGHIYIDIPKSSFNEVEKMVGTANDHVISIGAEFNQQADSHLVCFQNEDCTYQTRASSVPGKMSSVTGASFVVFNGALKPSSGYIAKSSIVEDGLMVQMPEETMDGLRAALRNQKNFDTACGKMGQTKLPETVTVRWLDRLPRVRTRTTSGVDGRSLDDLWGVRMRQDRVYCCDGFNIRCSEVFYRPPFELSGPIFREEVAAAACNALTRHLAELTASAINSFSLRVAKQGDVVEYQAGSGGWPLPQRYMNELDGMLIPVIHGGDASMPMPASDIELLFFITHAI
ncbi:zinc finger FYVE domain-containing protein 16 isoform X2 [Stigmatopora nigra]